MSESLLPSIHERDSVQDDASSTGPLNMDTPTGSRSLRPTDSFGEWSQFDPLLSHADVDDEEDDFAASTRLSQHEQNNERLQQQHEKPPMVMIELPPSLHPAVSAGMRHISSAYFSIHSENTMNNNNNASASLHRGANNSSIADLLSLIDNVSAADNDNLSTGCCSFAESGDADSITEDCFVHHDILMNIFGYLDLDSLAAFSETAKRPNFEVFYYLQLQLQRALLPPSAADDSLTPLAGTGRLVRLAREEQKTAESVVHGYLSSNMTLQQMPLSYSLAYIRQVLMRHQQEDTSSSSFATTSPINQPDASLLSGAALFVAFIGAASLTMSTANADSMTLFQNLPQAANELPSMLFRMGFLGTVMSAARSSYKARQEKDGDSDNKADGSTISSMMHRMMQAAYQTAYGENDPKKRRGKRTMASSPSMLFSPNPYDHLPPQAKAEEAANVAGEEKTSQEDSDSRSALSSAENLESSSQDAAANSRASTKSFVTARKAKKSPTGCVGAYRRAIAQATDRLVELVRQERMDKYKSLTDQEQRLLGTALLDACASDEGLEDVVDIVNRGIDVEDFYVASDGTETSALHAAAFHGCAKILDFLCRGLDESDNGAARNDGGLCQVNLKDSNGWSALHFAAGTSSIQSIQVLVQYGADLHVEAANGYTPLQWAVRLQNTLMADELELLMQDQKAQRLRSCNRNGGNRPWPSPARFFMSLAGTVQT